MLNPIADSLYPQPHMQVLAIDSVPEWAPVGFVIDPATGYPDYWETLQVYLYSQVTNIALFK